MDEEARRIGQRARCIRRAQGKSLDVIAGAANIGAPYLSMLERGERPWNSRKLTDSIASALGVKPTDLVGPPDADGSNRRERARAEISPLYRALIETSPDLDVSDVQPRSLAELHELAQRLIETWQAHQHREAIQAAIPLLRETAALSRTVSAAETVDVLWLHQQALRIVSSIMRTFGELPQALVAAERCAQVAHLSGDTVAIAYSAFPRIHALTPDGLYRPARELGIRALSLVEVPADERGLAVRGAVLLATAFVSAQAGFKADSSAMLYEADEIAQQTGDLSIAYGAFGPTNTTVHRMSIAVEAGDHDETIRLAERVNPRRITDANRRATFLAELGRAKAAVGSQNEAIVLFQRAERVSSLVVRRNPYVKDVVADILSSRRRLAVGPALAGLAGRLGVI